MNSWSLYILFALDSRLSSFLGRTSECDTLPIVDSGTGEGDGTSLISRSFSFSKFDLLTT